MPNPKKVLFICSANYLRSPTAELLYQGIEGLEAKSAGTDAFEDSNQLTTELFQWADTIYVMENHHRNKVRKMVGNSIFLSKKVIVLNILDDYDFMENTLINALRIRLDHWLGKSPATDESIAQWRSAREKLVKQKQQDSNI